MEIQAFIQELQALLTVHSGLPIDEKQACHGAITAFDFRHHLYTPLISVKGQALKITVSPVSLNDGEKKLVELLRRYCREHAFMLEGIDLYLLRNKSKVGVGFFEAGNFYPDYILWLDAPEKQTIAFIDPKGLRNILPDNPKITFQEDQGVGGEITAIKRTNRSYWSPYRPYAVKRAVSGLGLEWDRQKRQEHHDVLDWDDCVEIMMRKLLAKGKGYRVRPVMGSTSLVCCDRWVRIAKGVHAHGHREPAKAL